MYVHDEGVKSIGPEPTFLRFLRGYIPKPHTFNNNKKFESAAWYFVFVFTQLRATGS